MALATTYFPEFGMNELRRLFGQRWMELVDTLQDLPISDPHVMAFTRTIRWLHRTYNPDHSLCKEPFCALCASQVIANYEGSEDMILDTYQDHLAAIQERLGNYSQRREMVTRRQEPVEARIWKSGAA